MEENNKNNENKESEEIKTADSNAIDISTDETVVEQPVQMPLQNNQT